MIAGHIPTLGMRCATSFPPILASSVFSVALSLSLSLSLCVSLCISPFLSSCCKTTRIDRFPRYHLRSAEKKQHMHRQRIVGTCRRLTTACESSRTSSDDGKAPQAKARTGAMALPKLHGAAGGLSAFSPTAKSCTLRGLKLQKSSKA